MSNSPQATTGKIIALDKRQLRPAAEMLTRAFFDDLFIIYWYPDSAERARRVPASFLSPLRYAQRYGLNQTTSPNLEGAAVWFRPEYIDMPFWRLLLSGALRHAFGMGSQASRRIGHFGQQMTEVHHQEAPFPHWFLQIIGVDPEHQGKGYGSRLLREMLARADQEKLPCFLTTNKEQNIGFYEHHGFKVTKEFVVPGTDFKNWALLRKG